MTRLRSLNHTDHYPTGQHDTRQSEPCGQISRSFSGDSTYVPADTALACLRSVPLDKSGGAQQLTGLRTLVGFQSDLSYLIKPPPGYLYPAVDIMGGLDKIEDNLNSNFYSNEYDYQLDIYKLINAAYDGHFAYTPDIIGVFYFLRLISESLEGGQPELYQIFSVSDDGTSLPDVYAVLDADALIDTSSAQYKPSPITQINGDDVEDWLNTYAATSGTGKQQDPDSQYNGLFPSIPGNSVPSLVGGYGNTFAQATIYQGTDTVLKFANGTTRHVITEAAVSADSARMFARSVTDGASFFRAFCSGNILNQLSGGSSSYAPSLSPSSSAFPAFSSFPAKRDIVTERAAPQPSSGVFESFSAFPSFSNVPLSSPLASSFALPSASGSAAVPSSQVPYKAVPTGGVRGYSPNFPDPFVVSDDYAVAGYFPESEDDLAVLTIPTYEPASESQFSNVVRKLLATAKANGKTKLIIDLRGNPGGIALLATDTFKQLFPPQDPYGAGNYRANALFNFTGQSFSDFFEGTSGSEAKQDGTDDFYAGTPFNVDNEVTKAAKDFNSWADFFGPNFIHGDNYTDLTRWNLSDPDQRLGFYIYGYGENDKPQPQTFEANNIVLLQDGACASTCTLFAELMKNQGHVRSIVVGGRKQNGPMQAIGGVKGANVLGMLTIFQLVATAYQVASRAMQSQFETEFGVDLFNSVTRALSRAAPGGSSLVQASFNFRNNFREGDSSNTPLQFVYEAADWRFFYTAKMYASQELVWSKAYDIVWGNADAVPDSTGEVSSSFGNGYIMNPPPDNAASDDTIYPAKNLGKPVKPSATQQFNNPQRTGGGGGGGGGGDGGSGAAGLSVSVGGMLVALAATMFFL
ncbi:uncharacterized protein LTR77_009129 [Saxophila tyrrhenica]|uniref:Tail specific protease domain-containing protein n=1 Tax=Saxophila tyrrhenica TaxID=1690608 RepID=A0AAV9P0J6_9PEZI|nr:hypothetical protein LTR77_009129 [Saxophila tyrrhenica]